MSGNPYEDDSVDPDDANDALLEGLKADIASGGSEEPPDSADDGEVIIGASVAKEDESEGMSRAERRSARGQAWKEAKAERDDEVAKLREELAEARGRETAYRSQQVTSRDREPKGDAFESRREVIRKEREETLSAYENASAAARAENRALTKEEQGGFLAKNDGHNKDLARVDYDSFRAEDNTPERKARSRLMSRFSDLIDGGSNEMYLRNTYANMQARGEVVETDAGREEATELAVERTRRELKLGKYRKAPSATEKQRSTYGNVGGTGGKGGSRKGAYNPSPEERSMAIATYSHIDGLTDGQRVQKWVNAHKS